MNIKRNIAANFLGKVWAGALNFVFVPIYIKFLGIEAYGLIGFFTSIMAVSVALDMGLSTTLTRELARLASRPDSEKHARDFVRSLEYIYWGAGALLGVTIVALAPWLAHSWLTTKELRVSDTSQAIILMGVVAFLRWPATLYSSGLMGLQRQVLASGLTICLVTLQVGGAALVLWLVTPTIHAFFVWQIVAATVQLTMLPLCLWRLIPAPQHKPAFSSRSLKIVWKFAAGMFGITVCSVILTQLDKVLLSKLLSLEDFGYYVFASSIAGVLSLVGAAMYAALFPAFSSLISGSKTKELAHLYHRSCQLLSIMLVPTAIVMVLFSEELLSYYIRTPAIVEKTHVLLSLIAVGNMLLSLVVLPLALQLGYGWTTLSLYKNVVAVVIFVPVLIAMITNYGAIGAAVTWISLALGYVLIEIPLMHRRLLPNEKWKWYFQDVGVPLIFSVILIGIARLAVPRQSSPALVIPVVCASALIAMALSCFILPTSRDWMRRVFLGY